MRLLAIVTIITLVTGCSAPPPPALPHTPTVEAPPQESTPSLVSRADALVEDMRRREAEFKKIEQSMPKENLAALLQSRIIEVEESAAAAASVEALADPRRQDAIAALKAVTSAVNAGATRNQLREHVIAAKVKVDSVPPAPENRAIRRVADIFIDAVTLSVAFMTEELSAAEVYRFKTKYRTDGRFLSLFNVPMEGFGRTVGTSQDARIGAINADAGAQWLIAKANGELTTLR